MPHNSNKDQRSTWDEMLKFFRVLGGECENITLGHGPLGRGLFPTDPGSPILLHVPRALLFDINDVEFVNYRMQLKIAANVMEAHRAFFEKYEDAFSWGGGGRAESDAIIAALDTLPADVREMLIADFGFEHLFDGDGTKRTQRRFLESRSIQNGDQRYIAPLVELANHGPAGLPFEFGTDLDVRGNPQGEILVSYGALDALTVFQTFGFTSREPGAFCLPLNAPTKPVGLHIRREPYRTLKRGTDWIPQMTASEGRIELSYLMIGHQKFPRLSRGIFRMLMREAGLNDADEAFDSILNFNWTRYLKLLEVLEPYQGEMITTLRRMARYQIETMSRCIGSREPDAGTGHPDRDVDRGPAEQAWQISIQ